MNAVRDDSVWAWPNRGGVLAGLLLVLVGGLCPGAWAQAVDDTTRADSVSSPPRRAAPADLDTLWTGERVPSVPGAGGARADTGEAERAFVNADSLSTFQRGGERLQELFGNVFVRQDTTRVRSQYALRYLNRDELLFVDDVVIYERGDTLRADTVRYDRDTEVGQARGTVRLTNGEVDVVSSRATYYSSEKRSVFPDSVTLIDSTRVLRAAHGTYWSDEARAEFGGGVRLTDPGTTLLSDSLTYYRDTDRSIARGNVFIDRHGEEGARSDTTSRTYLFGDWADNREAERYSRIEGRALLMQVRRDSTGAPTDTLVVAARQLEAFRTDTHRRLVAVESVRIWQPDLSAVADSAVYDRVRGPTPDSVDTVPIDTARVPADSVAVQARTPTATTDTATRASTDSMETTGRGPQTIESRAPPPTDTTARRAQDQRRPPSDSLTRRGRSPQPSSRPGWAAPRWTTPTATADSVLPLEETRLFRSPVTWFEDSQVWGDSIRVRALDREPDTVFVRGSAFAAQRDSVLDRIQQLKAHNLVAFFRDGSLHRIRAEPNAEAIRFMAAQNDSLNGAARTSGDYIVLRFRDGAVRRISVVGGTQSTYYRKNDNIPDPFELEGFQWTPGRRPTKRMLLRDPRVQKRLDLELGPPPRRVAQTTPHSSRRPLPRPDSSAGVRRPDSQQRPAPRRPLPDSLRSGRRSPPDSMEAAPQSQPPADTSSSTQNPYP